mmetsp:Transcript_2433/g.6493  ORF Transcript_2433/g.6493 Transcript_2433/m.6493 type:complete len:140 (-) Transcript_2433:114-533(-)
MIARLYHTKVRSGVLEECLLLENPCEFLLQNGIIVVDCPNATMVAVYKQSKVITEGHLRVSFSREKKVLCWEFSTKSHEELVNRKVSVIPPAATDELGFSPEVVLFSQIAEGVNELLPVMDDVVKGLIQSQTDLSRILT